MKSTLLRPLAAAVCVLPLLAGCQQDSFGDEPHQVAYDVVVTGDAGVPPGELKVTFTNEHFDRTESTVPTAGTGWSKEFTTPGSPGMLYIEAFVSDDASAPDPGVTCTISIDGVVAGNADGAGRCDTTVNLRNYTPPKAGTGTPRPSPSPTSSPTPSAAPSPTGTPASATATPKKVPTPKACRYVTPDELSEALGVQVTNWAVGAPSSYCDYTFELPASPGYPLTGLTIGVASGYYQPGEDDDDTRISGLGDTAWWSDPGHGVRRLIVQVGGKALTIILPAGVPGDLLKQAKKLARIAMPRI